MVIECIFVDDIKLDFFPDTFFDDNKVGFLCDIVKQESFNDDLFVVLIFNVAKQDASRSDNSAV
jgi:hypothetical protein